LLNLDRETLTKLVPEGDCPSCRMTYPISFNKASGEGLAWRAAPSAAPKISVDQPRNTSATKSA
jgi:hypothetical protein